MKSKQARQKQQIVWASQLAEMAVCERRLIWKAQWGEQLTPTQRARVAAGAAMHADLHRQCLRMNPDARTTRPIAARYGTAQPKRELRFFVETLMRYLLRLLQGLMRKRNG